MQYRINEFTKAGIFANSYDAGGDNYYMFRDDGVHAIFACNNSERIDKTITDYSFNPIQFMYIIFEYEFEDLN